MSRTKILEGADLRNRFIKTKRSAERYEEERKALATGHSS
jgi:hypothetical protein